MFESCWNKPSLRAGGILSKVKEVTRNGGQKFDDPANWNSIRRSFQGSTSCLNNVCDGVASNCANQLLWFCLIRFVLRKHTLDVLALWVRVHVCVCSPVVEVKSLGRTDVLLVVVEGDHYVITLAISGPLTENQLVRHWHDVGYVCLRIVWDRTICVAGSRLHCFRFGTKVVTKAA